MFEILLTVCLAGAPSDCREIRLEGGARWESCAKEARRRVASWPPEETPQSWPCVRAGETPDFALTEIAPGVLAHQGAQAEPDAENRGDTANLGVVIGAEAIAVIDAGGSAETARRFLAAIRERSALPVRWLILTHMHPDHSLGAAVFAEAGATVIGHAKLPRALETRRESYLEAYQRLLGDAFAGTQIAVVGETVTETLELDLGGRKLLLEAHPTMHTDNDLTVFDERTGVWFLGDVFFLDHLPALDGSLLGWLAGLKRLTERRGRIAVPGHGPVAAHWPESAAATQKYLSRLETETRKAIADGAPMLEAIQSIGASEEASSGWLLFEAFHRRNATAAYRELEWAD